MRRLIITLTIAITCGALFVGGCTSANTGAMIGIVEYSFHPGNDISFSGITTFADGTVFQTQLYIDGQPQTWWPTERTFRVSGGKWAFSVVLVGLGPDVSRLHTGNDTDYYLRVWVQGNPDIFRDIPFDLGGPPPLQ